MKQIKFEIETVTPMFISGADGKSFELRPPSIKGLMRFWWRAAFWGENGNSVSRNDLEKEEGEIFGTTVNNGKKSCFSIRVKFTSPCRPTKDNAAFRKHKVMATFKGQMRPINILEYLAYGTTEYRRGQGQIFIREYLPPEQKIAIIINVNEKLKKCEKVKKQIIKSFYLLTIFGGIGAKSRNGFGNFIVTNPEIFEQIGYTYPMPEDFFFNKVFRNNDIPNYSAFSKDSKVFKLEQKFSTWHECLAALGKIYRSSRLNLERKHQYEKRQYIGAPIDVFKQPQSFLSRRSKPYFLHVTKKGPNYEGYILYLPSKYCYGVNDKMVAKPPIPANVDSEFENVCNHFNKYLSLEMKEVKLK